MIARHRSNILLAGAILFTVLAYSFAWAQFLYIVGPLLLFLSVQEHKGRQWTRGFFFGLFFYGASLLWLFSALPLDWAGVADPLFGFFLVSLLWIAMTLTLSAIPSISTYFWRVTDRTFFRAFIVASVWASTEYAVAFFSSLVIAGEGGVFGAHWAWITFGDMLAGSPIFNIIFQFGGLFAGSFILIFIVVSMVGLITTRNKREILIFSSVSLIVVVSSLLSIKFSEDVTQLTVAVVQTDNHDKGIVTAQRQRSIWQGARSMLDNIAREEPEIDLLVLPEDIRFSFLEGVSSRQLLPKAFQESLVVVDSGRRGGAGTALGVRYLSQNGEIIAEHNKTMLVPGGEYIPYVVKWISNVFNQRAFLEKFNALRKTALGNDAEVVTVHEISYGTLPCAAVLSPMLYRDLARDGSDVLVNTASQSLLNGNRQFAEQLRRRSQVHAASLARPYVQATNGGESLIINRHGTVLRQSPIGEGYTIATIDVGKRTTPYIFFGNWWLGIFIFYITSLSTRSWYIKKQQRSKVI